MDALHPLGLCKMSNTNMLIRGELRQEYHEADPRKKNRYVWQRARAANDRYVIVSHVQNAAQIIYAVSFLFERLQRKSGRVGYSAGVNSTSGNPFVSSSSSPEASINSA